MFRFMALCQEASFCVWEPVPTAAGCLRPQLLSLRRRDAGFTHSQWRPPGSCSGSRAGRQDILGSISAEVAPAMQTSSAPGKGLPQNPSCPHNFPGWPLGR